MAKNAGLKILETEYVTEDYAICMALENKELKDKIDDALLDLEEEGVLQEIISKYIPAEE